VDFKAVDFNRLPIHKVCWQQENRPPISALQGRILAVRRRCLFPRMPGPVLSLPLAKTLAKNQKPPIYIGGPENPCAMKEPPLHERAFLDALPLHHAQASEPFGMGLAHHCFYLTLTVTSFAQFVKLWGVLASLSI